jgi:hypothetical protein
MAAIADATTEVAGHLLIALSVPFVVAYATDPPHALEPLFLSLGLLAQIRGRRERALTFAGAAIFIKPSMGYLYVGLLLVLIVWDRSVRGELTLANLAKAVAPAVVAVLVILGVVLARFGLTPTLRSLFPMAGAQAYRALHYGLGGIETFLYFPGVRIGYYIGSTALLWTCGSVYLVAAAIFSGVRSFLAHRLLRNTEIIVTCALLHISFITLFFGSPSSWTYYAYILIIGAAATTELWLFAPALLLMFCFLAALVDLAETRDAIYMWHQLETSPATAGLYAPAAERAEWAQVASLAKSRRPAMLHWLGGAEVLFPWLSEPTGAFFLPGIAMPGEIAREEARLKSADIVIVPDLPVYRNEEVEAAGGALRATFSDAKLIFDGNLFRVYERNSK